jgi:hypothetical protein
MGEPRSPHRVQYIEKELQALESIISDNTLTDAEALIEKLKLNLSVNKIQYLWRKRQKKAIPLGIASLLAANTVSARAIHICWHLLTYELYVCVYRSMLPLCNLSSS